MRQKAEQARLAQEQFKIEFVAAASEAFPPPIVAPNAEGIAKLVAEAQRKNADQKVQLQSKDRLLFTDFARPSAPVNVEIVESDRTVSEHDDDYKSPKMASNRELASKELQEDANHESENSKKSHQAQDQADDSETRCELVELVVTDQNGSYKTTIELDSILDKFEASQWLSKIRNSLTRDSETRQEITFEVRQEIVNEDG